MHPAPNCRRCPRLAALRRRLRRERPDYHNAPVRSWGDSEARVLIVGLAPGLHGANRTGLPFQGDASGDFLFRHLESRGWVDPGGKPRGLAITNAVKCLPPDNRPTGSETAQCNRFLRGELKRLEGGVVLALGRIAHDAVLKARGEVLAAWPFGHARLHELPRGAVMIDSYHCSRYNTQTGRLTDAGFGRVMDLLEPWKP